MVKGLWNNPDHEIIIVIDGFTEYISIKWKIVFYKYEMVLGTYPNDVHSDEFMI